MCIISRGRKVIKLRQDFSSGFWSCGKTDHTKRSETPGVCMCMYAQMDVHTYAYICMCIYMCTYACMCTYMWCALFWLVTQSGLTLFVTPWMAARQASLSMVFSRQEYWYWSGLPSPSPVSFYTYIYLCIFLLMPHLTFLLHFKSHIALPLSCMQNLTVCYLKL